MRYTIFVIRPAEGLFVGSVACLASSGGYCSNRLARDPIITLGTIVSIDFSPIY